MPSWTDTTIPSRAAPRRIVRLSLLFRAIEVWLILSVIEIIHGVARIALLEPLVGDFPARQIAVFSGSLLILATAFAFRKWLQPASVRDCLLVGLTWVVLTLCFEFGLGWFVLGLSWERLTSDYNLIQGGLMPIGLLVMLLSPLIAFRASRA